MPSAASVAGKGLFQSLVGLASTLVAVIHTRIELFSNDLEDAQAHVFSLLVTTLAAFFLVGVGVVLATLLIVIAFWETDRILVLGSLTAAYLLAGAAAGVVAMRKARKKQTFFATTLAELRKDRACASRP